MAFAGAASLLKAPTMLEQLLEEINFQRTKEMRQLLKDDSGFVMLQGTTYWTDLFVRHFLFQTEHCIDCDDLLFFVRKRHVKGSSRYLPKFETEVDVFRKDSRKLPIGDPDIDWEETVYLNLIIHQFDYTLTLAICTRTSPNELQVLKRHSQKVYASPSRRRMDMKGEVEEMTYPHICFMVDNFDEVFCDILVRDGEMVCVELVASDRDGAIQGVIFLGSIRYDALKKVYDARSSLSSKMAQRMTFGLFSGATTQRVEFVRMKGPQGKGHAEMAVTKPKGSGAETPTSEPGLCATDMWDSDWDEDPEDFFVYTHRRRLSDPSANLNNFVRGGWKTKPYESSGPKSRSENEGLDSMANGVTEIEAGDVRDELGFCLHSSTSTATTSCPPRCRCSPHRSTCASVGSMGMSQSFCEATAPPTNSTTQTSRRCPSCINNNEQCEGCLQTGHSLDCSYLTGHVCDSHFQNDLQPDVAGAEAIDRNFHDLNLGIEPQITRNGNKQDTAVSPEAISRGQNSKSSSHRVKEYHSKSLPKKLKDSVNNRAKSYGRSMTPPCRFTPDGTLVNYWCDLPRRGPPGAHELDDGVYNPLWTMRGFTQTFHFWKESRRAQSVPLNAFLTYITLPWWSITKDILDHREGPILTF
ncbi:uncharacterized protein LOC124606780 isoform X1 [Schistocerca americana]|uniref:uncharacterized protein LOC124606780 isoform X1 n=1 Tax=Schistocerca americana TaxID=7009 RepID=UPI001F4F8C05|nr:uncharacterized protein LOC124606780 isoform X1 [Schistocerca americana]